jgi:phospholipid/cholesterol/gamma-HCH transport system permease protein
MSEQHIPTLAMDAADLSVHSGSGEVDANFIGEWTAYQAELIQSQISTRLSNVEAASHVRLDLARVKRLDSVGALIIARLMRQLQARGHQVEVINADPRHETLLREVQAHAFRKARGEYKDHMPELLVDIGKGVSDAGTQLMGSVSFLGRVVVAAVNLLRWPRHFRAPAFIHQMELIALRGVPIIVLISFVVGGIISQQGIFQLRRFDAADFVVDLIGILTLRELGVLLASIMVAGRSGSAFTAEVGAMKMREEVDALRVMGFDPLNVLITPRLLALVIGLPMLTFLADMSALLGGGLVAWLYQAISPEAFLAKLQAAIGTHTFFSGLIKAPFMALAIGLIASNEGLGVRGSTEDLGRHVTASVVKSIFAVIVIDGLFAMFFAAIEY